MTIQAFFQAYVNAFHNYPNFHGRMRRRDFWPFSIINTIIYVILQSVVILSWVTDLRSEGFSQIFWVAVVIYGLYFLAVFLPALGANVRRLHDVGLSGWFMLVNLVPYIGGIALFVVVLLDSNQGPNKWGPDPKARGWGVPPTSM